MGMASVVGSGAISTLRCALGSTCSLVRPVVSSVCRWSTVDQQQSNCWTPLVNDDNWGEAVIDPRHYTVLHYTTLHYATPHITIVHSTTLLYIDREQ